MREPAVIIIQPDHHKFLGESELKIETGEISFFEIIHVFEHKYNKTYFKTFK